MFFIYLSLVESTCFIESVAIVECVITAELSTCIFVESTVPAGAFDTLPHDDNTRIAIMQSVVKFFILFLFLFG